MTSDTEQNQRNRLVAYAIILFICGAFFGGFFISKCSAAHDYYEIRPTIDSNPMHQADYKVQQEYGRLNVIMKCAGNTLSPTFIITNLDANVSKTYSIDATGQFDDEFSLGNYSAYLPDGNGGQPEPIQYFTVNPQKTSYVVFLGHAISQPEIPKVSAKPTVQPTTTPSCHWHEGHWERQCIGSGHHRYCFDLWIPGYWHCGGCPN